MLKKVLLVVGTCFFMNLSSYVFAQGVKITTKAAPKGPTIEFMATTGDVIIFKIRGLSNKMPECASTKRYTLNKANPLYKEAKQAFEGSWLVKSVAGTGECKTWPNAEDVKTIAFQKP